MKRLFVIGLTVLILSDTTLAVSFQAHVTESGTNQPAAQALIVFSQNGVEKARNITSDDGRCFIRDIPDRTYLVKIPIAVETKSILVLLFPLRNMISTYKPGPIGHHSHTPCSAALRCSAPHSFLPETNP